MVARTSTKLKDTEREMEEFVEGQRYLVEKLHITRRLNSEAADIGECMQEVINLSGFPAPDPGMDMFDLIRLWSMNIQNHELRRDIEPPGEVRDILAAAIEARHQAMDRIMERVRALREAKLAGRVK